MLFFLSLCVWVFSLYVCPCTICMTRPKRPEEGPQIWWNWSYRRFWAILWVLGVESGFSIHRTISPAQGKNALRSVSGWHHKSGHWSTIIAFLFCFVLMPSAATIYRTGDKHESETHPCLLLSTLRLPPGKK